MLFYEFRAEIFNEEAKIKICVIMEQINNGWIHIWSVEFDFARALKVKLLGCGIAHEYNTNRTFPSCTSYYHTQESTETV